MGVEIWPRHFGTRIHMPLSTTLKCLPIKSGHCYLYNLCYLPTDDPILSMNHSHVHLQFIALSTCWLGLPKVYQNMNCRNVIPTVMDNTLLHVFCIPFPASQGPLSSFGQSWLQGTDLSSSHPAPDPWLFPNQSEKRTGEWLLNWDSLIRCHGQVGV